QVDLPRHPLPVAVCYPSRNADDNGVRRHLAHHNGAGADAAPVADLEGADDLGAGADHDVVAEGRMALAPPETRPAERHALQQGDVLTDLRGLADHDAHTVVDEEPRHERRGRMDLDVGRLQRAQLDEEAATIELARQAGRRDGGTTAVGLKADLDRAPVADAQEEAGEVAAPRVLVLPDPVRLAHDAGVPWIQEMVHE